MKKQLLISIMTTAILLSVAIPTQAYNYNGYNTSDYVKDKAQKFCDNLASPLRATKYLLQGDLKSSKIETARFLTNTIFGIGGVNDYAANDLNIRKPRG